MKQLLSTSIIFLLFYLGSSAQESHLNYRKQTRTTKLLQELGGANPEGRTNMEWLRGSVGANGYNNDALGTAIDNEGNIIVVGYFQYKITFGHIDLYPARSPHLSPIINNTTVFDQPDNMFVVKFNPEGEVLWARSAGTNTIDNSIETGYRSSHAQEVTVDTEGNIYVTGGFNWIFGNEITISWPNQDAGWIDFGNNVRVTSSVDSYVGFGPRPEMFTVKYSPEGIAQWAIGLTGIEGMKAGSAIAVDGENVYVSGFYMGESQLTGGLMLLDDAYEAGCSIANGTTCVKNDKLFALAVSKHGAPRWVKNYPISPPPSFPLRYRGSGSGLEVTSDGNVIAAGSFQGEVNFGNGYIFDSGEEHVSILPHWGTVSEDFEMFVTKINGSSGETIWAKKAGATNPQELTDVVGIEMIISSTDDIYVSGYKSTPAIFGIGEPNQTLVGQISTNRDGILARLNGGTGSLEWIVNVGINSTFSDYYPLGVGLDLEENVYLYGNNQKPPFEILQGNGTITNPVGGSGFCELVFTTEGLLRSYYLTREDAPVGRANSNNGIISITGRYGGDLELAGETLIPVANNEIFVIKRTNMPSIIVNVTEYQNEAAMVELWSLDNQSVVKAINSDDKAIFLSDEIEGMDVYDLYVLRSDSSLLGKINLNFKEKNRKAQRTKEILVTVHNDLTPYQDHPIEGGQWLLSNKWVWKEYYKYDYKEHSSAEIFGTLITSPFYPTSMLIPPANEEGSYLLSNVDSDKKPILFVHGYTDIDHEWGSADEHIIDPDNDPKDQYGNYLLQDEAGRIVQCENQFGLQTPCPKSDYVYTSIPTRVRLLSQGQLDPWEFYYPPDQPWDESGFLLGRDIKKITSRYTASKVSVTGYSMGGLVTGSYISESSKGYLADGSTLPNSFDNDIDKFLLLASPQHGVFGGNRGYWEIFLPEFVGFFVKDIHAPALRDLSAGGRAIADLFNARKVRIPGNDGVEYLSIGGTKTGVPINFLNGKPSLIESLYHSDGSVPVSSASLLSYGIDYGLLEGFHHGTFTQEIDELVSARRNLVPRIVTEFFLTGQISPALKADMLTYIDGNDPTAIPAPVLGTNHGEVRLDITYPYVSFKKPDGSYLIPKSRHKDRFRLNTEVSATGEKLAILSKENLKFSLGYVRRGQFLYYSENNFSEGWFKKNLLTNNNYRPSNLFYPYEKPFLSGDPWDNPLDFTTDRENILSEGGGWHVPAFQSLDLGVWLAYLPPKFDFLGLRSHSGKYAKVSTADNKLKLRWSQSTLNEFEIPSGGEQLLESNEIFDKSFPGALTISDFQSKNPINLASKRAQREEERGAAALHNWIDSDVNTASFVLLYDPALPTPELSLEDPTGSIIHGGDANGTTIFYDDEPEASKKYFSIVNPAVGKWKPLINGTNQLPSGNFDMTYALNTGVSLALELDTLTNPVGFLKYLAYLDDETANVSNLQVHGYYFNPTNENSNVSVTDVIFNDQGIDGDDVAGDNRFTALRERGYESYELIAYMIGEIDHTNFIRRSELGADSCELQLDFSFDANCLNSYTNFVLDLSTSDEIDEVYWDFGDGTTETGLEGIKHRYLNTGDFNATAKAVTISGCVAEITKIVTVHPSMQRPVITNVGPVNCYPEDPIYLDGGEGYHQYDWFHYPDGYYESLGSERTLTVTPDMIPDHIVLLAVENEFGCRTSSINNYNTFFGGDRIPIIQISGNPPPNPITCDPSDELTLFIPQSPTYHSYLWSTGETTPFITVSGDYDQYQVTVQESSCGIMTSEWFGAGYAPEQFILSGIDRQFISDSYRFWTDSLANDFRIGYQWNFGEDATPSQGYGTGPYDVFYSEAGRKKVRLINFYSQAWNNYCTDTAYLEFDIHYSTEDAAFLPETRIIFEDCINTTDIDATLRCYPLEEVAYYTFKITDDQGAIIAEIESTLPEIDLGNVSGLILGNVYDFQVRPTFIAWDPLNYVVGEQRRYDHLDGEYGMTCSIQFAAPLRSEKIRSSGRSANVFIYPNPNAQILAIKLQSETAQYYSFRIVDVSGKVHKTSKRLIPTTNVHELSIMDLEDGVYIVNISLNNGERVLKKLMVDRK